MSAANGAPFSLEAQDAALLRTGSLSIMAASRGPGSIPSMARALGIRLSADFHRITLFFPSSRAQEFLDDIASNGVIAAVFCVPGTHESLQLKGTGARVEKIAAGDAALVSSCCDSFVDDVEKLGYRRDLIRQLVPCESQDLVAVTFTPSAAFSQTPGPSAGHAIGVTA